MASVNDDYNTPSSNLLALGSDRLLVALPNPITNISKLTNLLAVGLESTGPYSGAHTPAPSAFGLINRFTVELATMPVAGQGCGYNRLLVAPTHPLSDPAGLTNLLAVGSGFAGSDSHARAAFSSSTLPLNRIHPLAVGSGLLEVPVNALLCGVRPESDLGPIPADALRGQQVAAVTPQPSATVPLQTTTDNPACRHSDPPKPILEPAANAADTSAPVTAGPKGGVGRQPAKIVEPLDQGTSPKAKAVIDFTTDAVSVRFESENSTILVMINERVLSGLQRREAILSEKDVARQSGSEAQSRATEPNASVIRPPLDVISPPAKDHSSDTADTGDRACDEPAPHAQEEQSRRPRPSRRPKRGKLQDALLALQKEDEDIQSPESIDKLWVRTMEKARVKASKRTFERAREAVLECLARSPIS
jgi:hypothetical protein